MLVELRRATENEMGEVTGEAPIAFDPTAVAAFFGSEHSDDQTLVALANGSRFKIFGSYAEVKERFNGAARFVEFRRPDRMIEPDYRFEDEGEDDGIGAEPSTPPPAQPARYLSVNPAMLAALHSAREPQHAGQCVIKTRDGRGLYVMGDYAAVRSALEVGLN